MFLDQTNGETGDLGSLSLGSVMAILNDATMSNARILHPPVKPWASNASDQLPQPLVPPWAKFGDSAFASPGVSIRIQGLYDPATKDSRCLFLNLNVGFSELPGSDPSCLYERPRQIEFESGDHSITYWTVSLNEIKVNNSSPIRPTLDS
ncbi:uncharacterized protein EI90DRAFT_3011881 [Cantharellus anzutake]|uniref:uncharacterized protein n=1 Tax=Cantharellus anzutake TaxID=1750568 RepID=UPI00190735BC|nr:uncharacterized protein EI90DRAFT_3011881 [Cantharellus anzutake]KAF8341242.1 hypothetical protein EI90DRAFT_3011881 [Cantharellus anzutake]